MLRNTPDKKLKISNNDFRADVSKGLKISDYLANRAIGNMSTERVPRSKCDCKESKGIEKVSVMQMLRWVKSFPNETCEDKLGDISVEKSLQCCDRCSVAFPFQKQRRTKSIKEFALWRLPSSLQERKFDLSHNDKIFASAWLNTSQVIVGTKCQKLYVIDILTGSKVFIPNISTIVESELDRLSMSQSTGIHSIALNPSKTLMAVGAGKPNETIQVFRVPTLEPYCTLQGHTDMVFSVTWLSDNMLISGSRDRSLKIWKISDSNRIGNTQGMVNVPIYKYLFSEIQHKDKIRDLVLDRKNEQTFSLSADGFVKIWDVSRMKPTVKSSVPLNHCNETVCIALDPKDNLVSVGSQAHISLLDPRAQRIIHSFESMDEGWGVRSMLINENILTIGGGYGRISFYDLRATNYISWTNINAGNSLNYMESGKGWLQKDDIYHRHFQGIDIKNAVYTIAYDSSDSKLFAAGGPLQLNLKGSYCALWE